ncbi:MAG: AmmeMemoRadiSam system radical SAM enzyme [Thermodesulfobacteriota bacterium]
MQKEAMLYEALGDRKVHCYLCGHQCTIGVSKFGVCGVRQNLEGRMITHAYGRLIAAHADPVEKKPLYHFLPGTGAYSVAAAGCNFRCGFCQNWQISQLRGDRLVEESGSEASPQEIVERAQQAACASIAYTYTEPTIFFEYALDTARLAAEKGLFNVFVTNGFMTPEALESIHPYLDACNVDLKSFREDFYREVCHGRLQPVLESIRAMKRMGIWVEITTLIIPERNDGEEELRDLARFIAGVDPAIPWHVSRFHPDYLLTECGPTPLKTLRKAYAIGKEEGLLFVYTGNLPGEETATACPQCGTDLIRRLAFFVKENRLKGSQCPRCGATVAGVFSRPLR